jgi:hypothetical protein
VYDPGAGDGVLEDPSWRWYDVVEATAHRGTFTKTAFGFASMDTLEIVPGVGLACRPFLVLKDTFRAFYLLSGGVWEDRRPATGAPRICRLTQLDTTPDKVWQATSTFLLPENPSFAFSLLLPDTPADQAAASPVYVSWGGVITVECRPEGILVWHGGQCKANLATPRGSERGELWVVVRWLRGRVLISLDGGNSYATVANTDGSAITIPQERIVVRGKGRACQFGLHELKYYAGTYTSPAKRTNLDRATAPTVTAYGDLPAGCKVDTSGALSTGYYAQYQVTLTPAAVPAAAPITFYRTPVVAAVYTKHPPKWGDATGTYTTPFDGLLAMVQVDKPYELHNSTATLQAKLPTFTFDGSWWFRKVEILLGMQTSDGSTLDAAWVGYVREVTTDQQDSGEVLVNLVADCPTIQAKTRKWDDTGPLGGQTAAEALDELADLFGVPADKRRWDPKCSATQLPMGAYEDPSFWPVSGDPIWQIMEEIAKHAGCELGILEDGTWYTVALGYVAAEMSATWRAQPQDDILERLRQARLRFDGTASATGIVAKGEDAAGNPLQARYERKDWADAASSRYCPWPILRFHQITGATTSEALRQAVLALYDEVIPLRFEPEVTGEARTAVGRRSRVRVVGTLTGIEDTEEFAVFTLRHTWRPGLDGVETAAGLRRV